MSPFDVEAGGAAHTPAEERHGWLSWMFPRRSVTGHGRGCRGAATRTANRLYALALPPSDFLLGPMLFLSALLDGATAHHIFPHFYREQTIYSVRRLVAGYQPLDYRLTAPWVPDQS